jgi:hypothetical protein
MWQDYPGIVDRTTAGPIHAVAALPHVCVLTGHRLMPRYVRS